MPLGPLGIEREGCLAVRNGGKGRERWRARSIAWGDRAVLEFVIAAALASQSTFRLVRRRAFPQYGCAVSVWARGAGAPGAAFTPRAAIPSDPPGPPGGPRTGPGGAPR
jgi:hypothetical protein